MSITDDRPRQGLVPPRDPDLPEAVNDLLLHYNDSLIARRCYVVAAAAWRFRHRTGGWPTRRELIHRVRYAVPLVADFEAALENLALVGIRHRATKVPNRRGCPTVYIEFGDFE